MWAEITFFPREASTNAHYVDTFFYFLVSVTGAAGLLVGATLIYFAVRYRRRPGAPRPPYIWGNVPLELAWTVGPLGIFMVFFVWGATIYFGAYRAPDDATVIYGMGKQWMWKFQHPEGQREINTLHVSTDRPFKIMLTSQDVIHSFFVPAFRVHMDVLPGRYTSVWFQATKPGTYHLFCSQYCGTNHAGMVGTVVVMEPADYENWLHYHAEGSLALQGRKVFLKYRCVSCHTGDATGHAPTLEEMYDDEGRPRSVTLNDGRKVFADEAYIRESILDPGAKIVAGYQNIMPSFKDQVSEEEIYELIAFIKALKRGQTPRRVEQYPRPVNTPPINTKK